MNMSVVLQTPNVVNLMATNTFLRRLYEMPIIITGTTRRAVVYEMIEHGNFTQLFESLGERGRLTREQMKVFCRDYPDKLCTTKYGGTFFELEDIFALVRVLDGGVLKIREYNFSNTDTWDARCAHRLVTLL
jgi:hypothetical protein